MQDINIKVKFGEEKK